MQSNIVIGLGETGMPLLELLREAYGDMAVGYDKDGGGVPPDAHFDVLHICIGWSERFVDIVEDYQRIFTPDLTIIHSTVPVGTTAKIEDAVHSPILGTHRRMKQDMRAFTKWIGGHRAPEAERIFSKAGLQTYIMPRSEHTEYLKLRCLSLYGVSIAFAAYDAENRAKLGISDSEVWNWDANYNEHVLPSLKRPVISPPADGKIGGHCVVPGARLLGRDFPSHLLDEVMRRGDEPAGSKTWQPSNVYPSAKIGLRVNIGAFSEIGANVVIGDDVRIGAMSFIPEGVTLEDGAWIGPRVTFTNDVYPPSGKENWLKTRVCKGARLGAAVTVLPGVTIGAGALIGAGSVVCSDVGGGEVWKGVPAKFVRRLDDREKVPNL